MKDSLLLSDSVIVFLFPDIYPASRPAPQFVGEIRRQAAFDDVTCNLFQVVWHTDKLCINRPGCNVHYRNASPCIAVLGLAHTSGTDENFSVYVFSVRLVNMPVDHYICIAFSDHLEKELLWPVLIPV